MDIQFKMRTSGGGGDEEKEIKTDIYNNIEGAKADLHAQIRDLVE
jgi:hypothetical protein